MANPIRRLVQLVFDKKSAEDTSKKAKGSLDRVQGGVDKLSESVKKLGKLLAGAFVLQKAKEFTRFVFEIGTSIEETGSKFETVFGDASGPVNAFITDFGLLAGLTRREGQGMAATMGAIAQGMGQTVDQSAEFSTRVLQLAGDLQSFHDIPIEETFAAIRSGVTGETEPLKRLGIVLSQDEVNARALAETGKRLTKELTSQEITTARLNAIYEKAGVAVGDLERTQSSTANTARRLSTVFRQIQEDVAGGFIPVLSLVINAWADVSEGMTVASRVAQRVGSFLTSFVGGIQIAAVELNAWFRTIPARFRVYLSEEINQLASWISVVEGTVNKIRGLVGAEAVDWTSGLRESAARLRSQGEADIVAFRALVEEESMKILRAANVIKDETSNLPTVGATGTEEGGSSGSSMLDLPELSERNVNVMDQMTTHGENLVGTLGEVREGIRLINDESTEMGLVASTTGEVLNAALGAGIGTLAAGKAKQNAIMAAEQTAMGIVAALNPLTAAKAAGHFAAAGKFAGIATAWGTLSSATGGGGGIGSGSVGSAGVSRDIGGSGSERSNPVGPELSIYFTGEGFDALNPKVQRVVRGALQQAENNAGPNARVRTFRGQIPQG